MSGRRSLAGVGIAGVALIASACLSACGSSGGSGGSTGASSGAAGGSVKIMAIFDFTGTQGTDVKWYNAVVAGVGGINARGGVKGRHLELIKCDSQSSANGSAACGRQAVADKVIATVGFPSSAAYDTYTVPAHIADFNADTDPLMLNEPNSFTFWGATLAATAGLAAMGRPAGCKKIAWVTSYVPPADRAGQAAAFAKTAEASGMQVGAPVFPVAGSPDMSPFAETAISEGVDCVGIQGLGADEVAIIKAFRQAKPSVKILTAVPFLEGNEQALGSLMSGLYIQDVADEATDTSNSAVKEWLSDITKYSPSPKDFGADSGVLWAEARLAAYAAEHVSDPTAANVENYLSHLAYYNPGVLPPVSFTHRYPTPLGTRVFGPVMRVVTYKNGKYYNSGPFYNVFTGKPWVVTR